MSNIEKMKVVLKVMESLVTLFNLTVERFDLESYDYGGIEGYAGWLFSKEYSKIVIHDDGSFEFSLSKGGC